MIRYGTGLAILCLMVPLSCLAQVSDKARSEIIRILIAEEAAAKVDMPLGGEGVKLSDTGQIDQGKLSKEIAKKGRSIQTGRIVSVTHIDFNDKSLVFILDGGGKE